MKTYSVELKNGIRIHFVEVDADKAPQALALARKRILERDYTQEGFPSQFVETYIYEGEHAGRIDAKTMPDEDLNNTDNVLLVLDAIIADIVGPAGAESLESRRTQYPMAYKAIKDLDFKGNQRAKDFLLSHGFSPTKALQPPEATVVVQATIPADMKIKDLADAIRPLGIELSVDSHGAPTIVPSR